MKTFIHHDTGNEIVDVKQKLVESILDFEGDLTEKMKNLEESYQELFLTSGSIELLIKNIFSKYDIPVFLPRTGNNHERFDALLEFDNSKIGLVEIEVPSTEMLDAPRNLLDDIAVYSCRRGVAVELITPIVICWTLPNKRTDFWNVLKDINNVLNIKIKTVPIMSLATLYWLGKELDFKNDKFYLDADRFILEGIVDLLKDNNIDPSQFSGFFEPIK